MIFLSNQSDVSNFFVDFSHNDIRVFQPLFYFGKWRSHHYIFSDSNKEWIRKKILDKKNPTNYIAFYGKENLENRLARFDEINFNIKYITRIEPGFLDKTLHYLNPKNRNETVYIYKILVAK